MQIKKYNSRPVTIEAVEYKGNFDIDLAEWCGGVLKPVGEKAWILVFPTLEGDVRARKGDFIIKGTEGEFYPCRASIMARKYKAQ